MVSGPALRRAVLVAAVSDYIAKLTAMGYDDDVRIVAARELLAPT